MRGHANGGCFRKHREHVAGLHAEMQQYQATLQDINTKHSTMRALADALQARNAELGDALAATGRLACTVAHVPLH